MKRYVDIVEYARRGMAQRVKKLIESGADVNEEDSDGDRAIIVAAERNDIGILTLLTDAGADLNVKNHSGMTPLGYAIGNKSNEAIKLIRSHMIK